MGKWERGLFMLSSIENDASDSIKQMMAQMFQKIGAADTDGKAGISKIELSSVNAGDDVGGAAFLKSLNEKFDELDADADGQLSAKEIASSMPPSEPMGPPPGLEIDSEETGKTLETSAAKSSDDIKQKETNENLMDKIIEAFVNSFTDSYKKKDAGDDSEKAIASLTASANTDGKAGLSLDELASADTSKNGKMSGLVKDLIDNFTTYDKDGDGQLSQSEIKEAMPKQFSKQEMAAMLDQKDKYESFGSLLGSASGKFVQQLLDSYKNGNLSNLASTVSLAL